MAPMKPGRVTVVAPSLIRIWAAAPTIVHRKTNIRARRLLSSTSKRVGEVVAVDKNPPGLSMIPVNDTSHPAGCAGALAAVRMGDPGPGTSILRQGERRSIPV